MAALTSLALASAALTSLALALAALSSLALALAALSRRVVAGQPTAGIAWASTSRSRLMLSRITARTASIVTGSWPSTPAS